jgi:hypothetical protein
METITLTTKTHVDRKLVVESVVAGNMLCVLIILFVSLILHLDFHSNWVAQRWQAKQWGLEDTVEAMREYHSFYDDSPAVYSSLRKNSLYLLVGIPFASILVGVVLSLYRSVTIGTLLAYHFCCAILVLVFVFYVTLVLLCAHSVLSYNLLPPLHAECYL